MLAALGGCATAPVVVVQAPVEDARAQALPFVWPRAPAAFYPDPLMVLYDEWKGTRHRYGGLSRDGIDCSGFVQVGFRDLYEIELPRTTRDQARQGVDVARDGLEYGDLVFFKTGRRWRHVGIFLGGGRFLHVSSTLGVTISSLEERYWSRRYWKAVRIERRGGWT